MNILVTGNQGYFGSVLIPILRQNYKKSKIVGVDIGLFSGNLMYPHVLPELSLDQQIFEDVRDLREPKYSLNFLKDFQAIIHLAAISNDPMGKHFQNVTHDINFKATETLAKLARDAGIKKFIFASSASVYGDGGQDLNEDSATKPLTDYAKSKLLAEQSIKEISGKNFEVTVLRFSTACGWSPRFRSDLVLNDFTLSALVNKKIDLLSNGESLRPLIHLKDMSRAVLWALSAERSQLKKESLIINIGSNRMNLKVIDLANFISNRIGGVKVNVQDKNLKDLRSYNLNFNLFERLAPSYQPNFDLGKAVDDLIVEIKNVISNFSNFPIFNTVRLVELKRIQQLGIFDDNLNLKTERE